MDVAGLGKRFADEPVLSDVSFSVRPDEIVALLGPSGCGKTTTLRCIAGVETPDEGTISIDGDVVESGDVSKPPEQRHVGMVYQNYAIWPHKTVYENVVFPLKYTDNPFPESEYEHRVTELLRLVEIAHLKDEPATNLSGGQQQRAALARALVHDPDLLLLDEPLSNLDKNLRTSMRDELQKLQHEVGVSVLYVTHDQEEAFYLADRVLIMNDGEIVERGDPSTLSRNPESPFTRQFLGGWNRFDGELIEIDGERLIEVPFGVFPLVDVDVVPESIPNGPVQCFLRPTDVTVSPDQTDVGTRFETHGTVVTEGILGELYETTIAINDTDTEIVVRSEIHHDLSRGGDVSVQFDLGAVQVYSGRGQSGGPSTDSA